MNHRKRRLKERCRRLEQALAAERGANAQFYAALAELEPLANEARRLVNGSAGMRQEMAALRRKVERQAEELEVLAGYLRMVNQWRNAAELAGQLATVAFTYRTAVVKKQLDEEFEEEPEQPTAAVNGRMMKRSN